MTHDEIIEMAMMAGFESDDAYILRQELKGFAKFVAAKEREACANICYELMLKENSYEQWLGMELCMEAIRARGEQA